MSEQQRARLPTAGRLGATSSDPCVTRPAVATQDAPISAAGNMPDTLQLHLQSSPQASAPIAVSAAAKYAAVQCAPAARVNAGQVYPGMPAAHQATSDSVGKPTAAHKQPQSSQAPGKAAMSQPVPGRCNDFPRSAHAAATPVQSADTHGASGVHSATGAAPPDDPASRQQQAPGHAPPIKSAGSAPVAAVAVANTTAAGPAASHDAVTAQLGCLSGQSAQVDAQHGATPAQAAASRTLQLSNDAAQAATPQAEAATDALPAAPASPAQAATAVRNAAQADSAVAPSTLPARTALHTSVLQHNMAQSKLPDAEDGDEGKLLLLEQQRLLMDVRSHCCVNGLYSCMNMPSWQSHDTR